MANYELNVKINGIDQSVSTIGQLEQALSATNAELQKTEQTSKSFGELTRQAQNIENYLGVITKDASTFNNQLKAVSTTTSNLGKSFQQTADAAEQLGSDSNIKKLNTSIGETVNKSTSLRTELRQITQELQNLEPGSKRFQDLSLRAGELRDQIADTNNVVTALAGNTTERLGSALNGVVNVGITGLQGVVGSMQLFGVESERAREVMEKLQGLLLVTQAIQGFGGLPDAIAQITAGFSSLVGARAADLSVQEAQIAANEVESVTNTINTVSQEANTVATEAHAAASALDATATGAATVATEGFTAALASNPIGLIVVGLTALVAALFLFSGGEEKAKESIEDTSKAMNDQVSQSKTYADQLAEVTMLKKKLDILETLSGEERVKALADLDKEYLLERSKNFDEQQAGLKNTLDKQIEDVGKFRDTFKKIIVETSTYSVGSPLTMGTSGETKTRVEEIGRAELDGLTKNFNDRTNLLDKQRAEALKGLTKGSDQEIITTRKYDLEKLQAQVDYNVRYLYSQLKFLQDSSDNDKEAKDKDIRNLIKVLNEQKGLLATAYTAQVKLLADANERKAEEEERAAEEAERKRQAALDRQREQYKQAYDAIKSSIKTRLDEAQAIEEKYINDLTKLKFTTKLEEINFEKEQEEKKLNEIDKFRKEDVNKSVLKGKEKQKLVTQIEEETTQARVALDNFYIAKKQQIIDEELKIERKKSEDLKDINKILTNEISFGDQSVTDTKQALALKEEQLKLTQLEFERQYFRGVKNIQLENNVELLKNNEDYYNEVNKQKQANLTAQRDLDIAEAEATAIKNVGNFADYLEKTFGLSELARQKEYAASRQQLDNNLKDNLITEEQYLQQVANLDEKYREMQRQADIKSANDSFDLEKASLDKRFNEGVLKQAEYDKQLETLTKKKNTTINGLNDKAYDDTAQSYYKTSVNNETQVVTKKKEINQKYSQDQIKSNEDTEETILNARLAALDKWAKFAVDTLNSITGLFQAISDLTKTNLDNQLIDLKLYNEARQNEINTQFNNEVAGLQKQLQEGLISQEQYNTAVTKLEDNRASNSEKLLEAQRLKELKIKKKSFEDDKKLKIASAIISGIQGAVAAFTGAFTSIPNPIAAAVVGGLMAGLVAATTAVQVAAISKQKFDSSGTIPGVEAVSTSAPSSTTSAITQASSGGFTSFNQSAMGAPTNQAGTTPFSSGSQRVYVLESDITATQDRVRVLESNSTFG